MLPPMSRPNVASEHLPESRPGDYAPKSICARNHLSDPSGSRGRGPKTGPLASDANDPNSNVERDHCRLETNSRAGRTALQMGPSRVRGRHDDSGDVGTMPPRLAPMVARFRARNIETARCRQGRRLT